MTKASDIHAEMVARGFRRDRSDTAALRFTSKIRVRHRSITAAVSFEEKELTRIPKVYLLDRKNELPDAVAHLEENDRFCYVREENLLLDPLDPRGSIALCLIKITEALDRLIFSDLSDEIAQEFPQHWLGLPVYVDLPVEFSGLAFLYGVNPQGNVPRMIIAQSAMGLRRLGETDKDIASAGKTKAAVHVLHVPQKLTFKPGQKPPDTLQDLLTWLNAYSPQTAARLMELLPKAWPQQMSFLLWAANGAVGGTLGLPILLKKSIQRREFLNQLLASKADQISISRLYGIRIDADFIFRRNMPDQPNLSHKRIALVGLGTIGSHLAKFLAQSGAGTGDGQLLLIDEQELSSGNIGRHFLGLPYIGQNKAKAMQQELKRLLPDCQVNALEANVLQYQADLYDFDLVIDATGERAVSEVLNQGFVAARREEKTKAAIVYVWLVGNGVAAQALMVDNDVTACFRCLRLDESHDERFRLLKPDHPAVMTPANCGEGAFFAYGVGGPAIAAGLAIQIALDWAKGNPSPRFRTIRIVQEATFKVKDSDVKKREKCPVCGGA